MELTKEIDVKELNVQTFEELQRHLNNAQFDRHDEDFDDTDCNIDRDEEIRSSHFEYTKHSSHNDGDPFSQLDHNLLSSQLSNEKYESSDKGFHRTHISTIMEDEDGEMSGLSTNRK